jgi:hypothetical protein
MILHDLHISVFVPEHDGDNWHPVLRRLVARKMDNREYDIYTEVSDSIICPLSQGYKTLKSARAHAMRVMDAQFGSDEYPLVTANLYSFNTIK